MIPILYEKTEATFTSNGLGRLRDCISCIVTEERNGIYECDFEYPMDGANFDLIQIGRIIGVTHDESGDVQPFDIVSYSRPINGVVTFHAVHISYRQSYMTVTGSNINSLADAFTLLGTAEPSNPFTYQTDKTSSGYMAAADGIPRTVRQLLGGVEGSILDAYGGEYEWDKWIVKLHSARGQMRDFSIRYGVNMLNYEESLDSSSTYSSCIPYWKGQENIIIGDRVDSGAITLSGRGECVPLDVTDKFESEPTKADVEAMGLSMMQNNNTTVPSQNIKVEFARLQEMDEYANFRSLLTCHLCDTIKVIFPDYNSSGTFKIVKTVWNVLKGKYDEMELGDLSVTLSEALGISFGLDGSGSGSAEYVDYVLSKGSDTGWYYRKWKSGKVEAWVTYPFVSASWSTWSSPIRYMDKTLNIPSGIFDSTPNIIATSPSNQYWIVDAYASSATEGSMRIASVTSTAMATSAKIYAWTD